VTAQNERSEVITALIEAKITVDAETNTKRTSLHQTTQNEHSEIIRVLIEAQAAIDARQEEH
jgi:ankyrin repeat protein